MRVGRIQQVGTPTDLYGHPNNLFVAGFIGSPAMNFLPGHYDGHRLRTPIGEVGVPREMRQRHRRVRPEHFDDAGLVTPAARGHIFKTKIDVLETPGSDTYAHFTVDSDQASSRELPLNHETLRPSAWQLTLTAVGMVAVVNSVVIGACAGLAVRELAIGSLVVVLAVGATTGVATLLMRRTTDGLRTRTAHSASTGPRPSARHSNGDRRAEP
jgi:hypothetical protein